MRYTVWYADFLKLLLLIEVVKVNCDSTVKSSPRPDSQLPGMFGMVRTAGKPRCPAILSSLFDQNGKLLSLWGNDEGKIFLPLTQQEHANLGLCQ